MPKRVVSETGAQLAASIEHLATVALSGLVACRSGRHVTPVTHPEWRGRAEGEAAGTHADISYDCPFCQKERGELLASWATDMRVRRMGPRMLEALVALEWATGRCLTCPAGPAGKLALPRSEFFPVATGHDVQCSVDQLLTAVGLDTRESREVVRLALGQ